MKQLLLIVTLFILCGCSKAEPIKIPETKSEYFGVWQYKSDEFGSGIKIDNMLFIVHEDSTISYKRCSKWMNGQKNVSAPEGIITKFTEKEIVVTANIVFMTYDLEFSIETEPHEIDGEWYMKIDGALLRKLKEGEKSDYQQWDCGSKEEKTT